MRKQMFGGVALLVVAALAVAGGDPWKSKPFSQWTDKDVTDILLNSPWARANVTAQGAWRPDGMTQASGSGAIPGAGGSKSATGGTSGGDNKGAAGSTPD